MKDGIMGYVINTNFTKPAESLYSNIDDYANRLKEPTTTIETYTTQPVVWPLPDEFTKVNRNNIFTAQKSGEYFIKALQDILNIKNTLSSVFKTSEIIEAIEEIEGDPALIITVKTNANKFPEEIRLQIETDMHRDLRARASTPEIFKNIIIEIAFNQNEPPQSA